MSISPKTPALRRIRCTDLRCAGVQASLAWSSRRGRVGYTHVPGNVMYTLSLPSPYGGVQLDSPGFSALCAATRSSVPTFGKVAPPWDGFVFFQLAPGFLACPSHPGLLRLGPGCAGAGWFSWCCSGSRLRLDPIMGALGSKYFMKHCNAGNAATVLVDRIAISSPTPYVPGCARRSLEFGIIQRYERVTDAKIKDRHK